MSMSLKYNVRKIKAMRSYTPQELCTLFDISKKTVFRWIDDGLPVLEKNTRPLLVMGHILKSFLLGERVKIILAESEYYCLKCRKATTAQSGSEIVKRTGHILVNLQKEQEKKVGLCKSCGRQVQKFLRAIQND